MKLDFPNPSRSFDAVRHRIQFWAHDGALEISFFLDIGALRRMSPSAKPDESGFLAAFDGNRAKIQRAAAKIYTRHTKASYTLSASNF
jgi:hypothetical protein